MDALPARTRRDCLGPRDPVRMDVYNDCIMFSHRDGDDRRMCRVWELSDGTLAFLWVDYAMSYVWGDTMYKIVVTAAAHFRSSEDALTRHKGFYDVAFKVPLADLLSRRAELFNPYHDFGKRWEWD